MAATLMPTGKTLAELLPETPLAAGTDGVVVGGLSLDSRNIRPGDLFLAVQGSASDGRLYVRQALGSGAVAVLAEADGLEQMPDLEAAVREAAVPLVTVVNLQRQVSAIAGRFYGNPGDSLGLVGFTGTNGKTTCSQLLAQLFSLCGHKSGVIGTLGYGIFNAEADDHAHTETGMTTPDAVHTQEILAGMVRQGVERVAMEVSSHSLDQFRVAGIRFGTAVFTNLSRDHLDYHGDLASYGAAKAALFAMPGLRNAVINGDDALGRQIAGSLPPSVTRLVYRIIDSGSDSVGSINNSAEIVARELQLGHEGITARIDSPWGSGQVCSRLLGEFNLSNLLAVIGAACAEGVELQQVLARLPSLQPVNGRMQMVQVPLSVQAHAPQVVIDYAHTPDALEKALIALRRHCRGRLWVVFGCGGDRDVGKRPQMGAVAECNADRLVVTSDNPRSEQPERIIAAILAGLAEPSAARDIADRAEAINWAVAEAAPEDTVLIAGKGHENYQQVGHRRLPFSDLGQARLALRRRAGLSENGGGADGA